LILDEEKFLKYVSEAMAYAHKSPSLVTLGIRPSRPDTGYGYIQYIEETVTKDIHKVKTFTEKPTLEIAKTFIESGDFLWNAGIFIWSISSIKKAFKQHLPEQYDIFESASQNLFTENEAETIRTFYEQCRSISIDYGIMEKADNVYVIPSEFGWSDLGTWTSLYEISAKDENENAVKGKNVFLYNVDGCLVNKAETLGNKIIAIKSVKDLIIVDTPDVLLICDKNQEQEVKQIATDIKIKFNDKFS
jgi:mannose-1-phosphate guanylyltransferase